MLNWALFAVTSVGAYVFISMFGEFGGEASSSAVGAALSTFKPLPLVFLLVGNVLWGVAVYFGERSTSEAIPAAIALGVVTSFVFSAIFLGSTVTWERSLGVAVILLGVYLLR
jgi:hypothetical protein